MELFNKWKENMNAIGCECQIAFNGRIGYNLVNCPEKYRKSLAELTTKMFAEALRYVKKAFNFPVKKGDEEAYLLYVDKKIPEFLNTLISEGAEAFMASVDSSAEIMEMKSVASSLRDVQGEWKNWRGETFDLATGGWKDPEGRIRHDAVSAFLWDVKTK